MTDETLAAPDDDAEAKALGEALKVLRLRASMTQADAAEAMGLGSGEAWRVYEIGKSPGIFKPGIQFRLAHAVRASLSDLLVERDRLVGRSAYRIAPVANDPFMGGDRAELPIRDRIQAGAWLAADDMDQTFRTFPAARDGRYPAANQWISEVTGDSMNLLSIFDGDYVHCVDATDIGYHPRHGDIVEVERLRHGGAEREFTLKQIEMTAEGFVLAPRSTNPRWQSPLRLGEGISEGDDYEVRIRALVVTTMRRV